MASSLIRTLNGRDLVLFFFLSVEVTAEAKFIRHYSNGWLNPGEVNQFFLLRHTPLKLSYTIKVILSIVVFFIVCGSIPEFSVTNGHLPILKCYFDCETPVLTTAPL